MSSQAVRNRAISESQESCLHIGISTVQVWDLGCTWRPLFELSKTKTNKTDTFFKNQYTVIASELLRSEGLDSMQGTEPERAVRLQKELDIVYACQRFEIRQTLTVLSIRTTVGIRDTWANFNIRSESVTNVTRIWRCRIRLRLRTAALRAVFEGFVRNLSVN